MRFLFLLPLLAMMFSIVSCGGDSPGAECCDCLIENSCWTSSGSACYYYHDDDYDGGNISPPPAQSWYVDCENQYCSDICDGIL